MEKVCLIKAASETEHVHPRGHHSAASVCGLMSTSTLGFYSCGALPPSCQETHSNLKMRGHVGGHWGAPVKSQHTASLTWHLGLSADCTPGSDPRGDRQGGPAPRVDPVFHASPENPTYWGAWGAAVHRATRSWTQPSTQRDYTMIWQGCDKDTNQHGKNLNFKSQYLSSEKWPQIHVFLHIRCQEIASLFHLHPSCIQIKRQTF